MAKGVTGIGGIFFKAKDPAKLGEWYAKHLDIEMGENMPMSIFRWRRADNPELNGSTVCGACFQKIPITSARTTDSL